MFPACRMAGDEFAMPPFDLTPRDVAGFTDELQEFQGLLHDCFPRSAPRAHFFDSMVGQWSALARKAIEPMALRYPGGRVRGLHGCSVRCPGMRSTCGGIYPQLVADEMGAPGGDGGGRLPASHWDRRQVSPGTQGPSAYALARQRVTLWKERPAGTAPFGLCSSGRWGPSRRQPTQSGRPHEPPLASLRLAQWAALGRGAMFCSRQNGRGMDHYAMRK